MPWPPRLRLVAPALLLFWLFAGTACAPYPPIPPEPEATPSAEPVPTAEPAPLPPMEPPVRAVPPPVPAPPPPTIPRQIEVLILYNEAVPAHAAMAVRVETSLAGGPYRLRRIGMAEVRSQEPEAAGEEPFTDRYAVAVGFEAATLAISELGLPTVFCQVFNYQPLLNDAALAWGVASIPPLQLQLQAWKRFDPSLLRVGMIIGQEHDELLREALEATAAAGVELRHERSGSDRETLFHFRRLAREIDGFWLFPDNRILSPSVIGEILNLATAHEVRVTAFNAASLPAGVFMNASASPEDVASTVGDVVGRLIRGDTHGLPVLSPLNEIRVDVEPDVAARLPLDQPAGAEPLAPD